MPWSNDRACLCTPKSGGGSLVSAQQVCQRGMGSNGAIAVLAPVFRLHGEPTVYPFHNVLA
jgi:hypothetical protein